MLSLVPNKP